MPISENPKTMLFITKADRPISNIGISDLKFKIDNMNTIENAIISSIKKTISLFLIL